MEEDIKILEELLNAKISFSISPTDYGYTAIQNLINKYKEQEKIIGLMANDLYELYKQYPGTIDKFYKHKICLFDDCDNINREVNCDYCFINYFKKKARDENGNNNDN